MLLNMKGPSSVIHSIKAISRRVKDTNSASSVDLNSVTLLRIEEPLVPLVYINLSYSKFK